ncbi:asparagine synthase-related protein [Roseinatronobacter monicus]|uniref:asparagine synthase-related protein n=1 Tax=Roseinatronobacter monicus TaxID=393481 RepID=UPI0014776DC8|nr:asparagine synthase-related protein [Roseinatronobacter monicus]
MINWRNQAILTSDGRPLGKCRLNASETPDIYSFMNAGFFGNDETFYPRVTAIPPYATLHVSGGRSQEKCEFSELLSGKLGGDDKDYDSSKYFDSITDRFISGFSALKGASSVEIQLSGGKDSRLVLAGMTASGMNVVAKTTDGGSHNFTDVYCAKLVADALKVEHIITKTAQRSVEATISPDDFYTRTVDTLKATDFGLISFGNLGFNRSFRDVRVFNGLGGELLRGGYSKGLTKQKVKYNSHSLLISKWGRFSTFFKKESSERYGNYITDWLEENELSENMPLAADAAYLYCRMGRWAAALARSGSMARIPTYPLLDNSFMEAVYSAPVEYRSNDRLLYEVLRRVNRDLVDIPLANDYWAFWDSEQIEKFKLKWPDAFRSRGDQRSGANLDWRANWVDVIGEHLFDFILSSPSSVVFDFVDRDRLESLRATGVNYGHRFLLFGIYSAVIASSNEFQRGVYSNVRFSLDDLRTTRT